MIDIKGYEGLYAVDKDGNVWSLNWNGTGRTQKLKSGVSSNGYLMINMCKDGKRKGKTVHRLVAEAFLPDYSAELDVDHIDRDKTNNNLSNLRMVTTQQNAFNTKAKGYCWAKQKQKWKASICKDYKSYHLGYFDTKEEAHQAYLDAKEIYHK